jgi:hypothetical protein
MSAGGFVTAVYESNQALFFPIRIQPETLTLTLNSVVNAAPANAPGVGFPSAVVSKGRRSFGLNARLVRVRTPNTGGDPNYVPLGIIALPVLQAATFASYGKGQTGTYEINGASVPVQFVGKTPETLN